jgi:hypothetical protein
MKRRLRKQKRMRITTTLQANTARPALREGRKGSASHLILKNQKYGMSLDIHWQQELLVMVVARSTQVVKRAKIKSLF